MKEITITVTGKPGSGKSIALDLIELSLIESGKFTDVSYAADNDHVLTAKLKV